MLDAIIYFLLKYTYVFISILFIIKFFLFFKHKNKNWTIMQFLYFHPVNIKLTANIERAKSKRTQNTLSIFILILLVIQVFLVMFFSERSA